MNIGFYDPISERWIKPRPEKEPDPVPCVSLGEALLNAVEAEAVKVRNAKIWEYLRQSAEGCNAPTAPDAAPIVIPDQEPVMVMQKRIFFLNQDAGFFMMSADGVKSLEDWS